MVAGGDKRSAYNECKCFKYEPRWLHCICDVFIRSVSVMSLLAGLRGILIFTE